MPEETMSSSSIGVGIVGYGLAGRYFHAPFIAAVDGLRVASIVTARPDRQAAARRDHPNAVVVERFEALLDRPDVEVVVVASPNRTHVPFGITALEAGRHVVVDKPIAKEVAEASRLVEAAERAGRVLTVYQNRRFDGDFLTVRSLVDAGTFGPMDSLESRFEIRVPLSDAWREDAAEAGGPHLDLGAHLVDQALLLFGEAARVYGQLDRRRPGSAIDDSVFVAIEHAGGPRSRLWTSLIAAWGEPRFHVRGLDSEYVKEGRDPQEAAVLAGARPTDPGFGEDPPARWGRVYAGDGRITAVPTIAGDYRRFYAQLRDAVAGSAPAPVDPIDAIRGLRILEAAERSARTGAVVEVART
jgi:scyllo-inositol 2-dehydrogenase (NADP+)